MEVDERHFFSWLLLDREQVTWQGKYEREFATLCTLFLGKETNAATQIQKLFPYLTNGPVKNWFEWLFHKAIVFQFLGGASPEALEEKTNLSAGSLGKILKDHFNLHYPEKRSLWNHWSTQSLESWRSCCETWQIKGESYFPLTSQEHLAELEVTLYPEWHYALSVLQKKSEYQVYGLFLWQILKRKRFFSGAILVFALVLGFVWQGQDLYLQIRSRWMPQTLSKNIWTEDFEWPSNNLVYNRQSSEELKARPYVQPSLEKKNKAPSLAQSFSEETQVNYEKSPEVIKFNEMLEGPKKQNTYPQSHKVYRLEMRVEDFSKTQKNLQQLISSYDATLLAPKKSYLHLPGKFFYSLSLASSKIDPFIEKLKNMARVKIYPTRYVHMTDQVGDRLFIVLTHKI